MANIANLATVLNRLGRYHEAATLHREALDLRREVLGPQHPDTLNSMHNLAFALHSQGQHAEAEPLSREVVEQTRKMLGPKHPDTLSSMNNLVLVLQSLGQHGEADPLSRELSTTAQEILGINHPTTLLFQLNLIVNFAAQGQIAAAVEQSRLMEPQVLALLSRELYTTEASATRRNLVTSTSDYQNMVLTLALTPGAGARAVELAALTLLRFKGVAVEEEAWLARLARRSPDPRVRAAAAATAALRASLARLVQSGENGAEGPNSQAITTLLAKLDVHEKELNQLLGRELERRLQVNNASLEDLQASLPSGAALLDLRQYRPVDFATGSQGNRRWVGVLITGSSDSQVRDLGSVAETAALVDAMRSGVASAETTSTLGRLLLGPFEDRLSNLDRLYVAPDGDLYLLPFVLLRDTQGRRLLDGLDVRILQSGRDLMRSPSDTPAQGLIAVGGIDFGTIVVAGKTAAASQSEAQIGATRAGSDAALRDGFEPLVHSREEAEAIGALYQRMRPTETVRVASGGEPTRPWLLGQPPPRVLHLATHGFYRRPLHPAEHPMLLAGVALAGANRGLRQEGGAEGLLYALEARDLNLEGTELVVLSACETGLGPVDYGEGVSGLVRALRAAGARNVLVTMRKVDDEAASSFMQTFYYHLLKPDGVDPVAALRETQRERARADDADDVWTSFVLVGQGGGR